MRLREEWIPLADGVRLAANVFTPDGSPPRDGWPALLEYLPYRKDDGLFERDWDLYSSMTERGYACVKVDIRGTGRSEGRPPDREYSEREQADAEEVIRWLAGQEWCSGGVGMWGISWGGFNAIQMAMRRSTPEALRAIVAIDASDDLFHDDVHLVDGLLHVDEYEVMIDLETARSPAPDFPLDERTLDERFDAPPWKLLYLRHQRDGEFWRRASLRPRYDRLRVPSLLIGGWYDGYRDSVLRMLEHVHRVPVRAILAPHDHSFPHRGSPGAPFEHRAEALRWFDRWVRGADARVADGAALAVFVRRWHPPGRAVDAVPGSWRLEDGWPLERGVERAFVPTAAGGLDPVPAMEGVGATSVHTLRYVPSGGARGDACSGVWWGDLQPDQRALDEHALVYRSAPVEEEVEVLGFANARLEATATAPVADWFVRLEDEAPDGSVVLVTGAGISGPQQAGSREAPVALEPGRTYRFAFDLHATSWTFERGHRLRFAVTNAMWPMVWPTPHPMTTTLAVGPGAWTRFTLPVVPRQDRPAPAFEEPAPPRPAPGWQSEGDLLPGGFEVLREGSTAEVRWSGGSVHRTPWGEDRYRESLTWRVDDDDPASASVRGASVTQVRAGEREIRWVGELRIASDRRTLRYEYRREVHQDGRLVRERTWREDVPRDLQ